MTALDYLIKKGSAYANHIGNGHLDGNFETLLLELNILRRYAYSSYYMICFTEIGSKFYSKLKYNDNLEKE